MRHSGDWMVLLDDRILEYLDENEAGSPSEIKRGTTTDNSRQHFARRCRRLAEEGLIREISNATYVLTDDGSDYLDGRLDTQNWIRLDEDGTATTPNGPGTDERETQTGDPDAEDVRE
jgi:hypothetical protein